FLKVQINPTNSHNVFIRDEFSRIIFLDLFLHIWDAPIKTHFFSAIRAFTQLELMRTQELIENWYEVQRNLSLQVARDFILEHLEQKIGLNSHSQIPVNA
ncbi:MAG TPA: hypothetical protein VE944_14910, partial [Nostoc sp.]